MEKKGFSIGAKTYFATVAILLVILVAAGILTQVIPRAVLNAKQWTAEKSLWRIPTLKRRMRRASPYGGGLPRRLKCWLEKTELRRL